MPLPTGGLLEITLNQTFGSRQLANVFHYWNSVNTEPVSFVALAADFNAKIVDQIALVQSTSIAYVSVRLRTVFGTLPDLVATPSQTDGDLVGDVLNSFTAFSYRLQGTTKETRAGSKRYAGITETNVAGNVVTGAFLILMDLFAAQMELPLDSGTTLYDPVIFSPLTLVRPTPFVNPVIEITSNSIVTSQISRKR